VATRIDVAIEKERQQLIAECNARDLLSALTIEEEKSDESMGAMSSQDDEKVPDSIPDEYVTLTLP
jgi:hypothetical protein